MPSFVSYGRKRKKMKESSYQKIKRENLQLKSYIDIATQNFILVNNIRESQRRINYLTQRFIHQYRSLKDNFILFLRSKPLVFHSSKELNDYLKKNPRITEKFFILDETMRISNKGGKKK